jgi:tetratricopeptide (TPR) repeat protein
MPKKLELIDFFASLPEEEEYQFQLKTTLYIEDNEINSAILLEIVNDNDVIADIRYAAFFTLCTYLRRFRKLKELGSVLDNFSTEFSHKKTFELQRALYFMSKETRNNLESAVFHIKIAGSKLSNEHIGFAAAFSDIILSASDWEITLDEGDIQKSRRLMENAVEQEPTYPKYKFLLAKTLLITEEFRLAQHYIQQAIDQEDPDNTTYQQRVLEYQRFQLSVQTKKEIVKIHALTKELNTTANDQMNEFRKMSEETKSQVLIQLGFFSGLLALILTAVDISQSLSNSAVLSLLITMSGLITFCWSAFTVFITGQKIRLIHVFVLIISLLIIVVGIVVLYLPAEPKELQALGWMRKYLPFP